MCLAMNSKMSFFIKETKGVNLKGFISWVCMQNMRSLSFKDQRYWQGFLWDRKAKNYWIQFLGHKNLLMMLHLLGRGIWAEILLIKLRMVERCFSQKCCTPSRIGFWLKTDKMQINKRIIINIEIAKSMVHTYMFKNGSIQMWVPRKCDYWTDRRKWMDRQTLEKLILMCHYALQATQKYIILSPADFQSSCFDIMHYYDQRAKKMSYLLRNRLTNRQTDNDYSQTLWRLSDSPLWRHYSWTYGQTCTD